MELKRNRNSVFEIGYHFVWCTKYRKPVLTEEVQKDLKLILKEISDQNSFSIEQMEIMEDRVHLFVTATPNDLIANIIKNFKGVSARLLFKKHSTIKKELYGGHLWNPSYYVGTVGSISEETVRKYIENQKKG
jgi:putative transposase